MEDWRTCAGLRSLTIPTNYRVASYNDISGVGEVLSDGTLQVTNSSSVFRKTSVAILSCSSREYGEEFTFHVLLQGQQITMVATVLPAIMVFILCRW